MFLRYWCAKGELQGYPCIDKEPNAVHSAGCEGVNQSFWAVQCLAQYVCLLCQHCTRFLPPPQFLKFIWRQLQEGRWWLLAMNSVLMILKDATGFLQTNFEERGMLFKTNKGTEIKSQEKLLIYILELWKKNIYHKKKSPKAEWE